MSESFGTMTGIDSAIAYLEGCQPRDKHDDMPDRIINRLRYIRAKEDGVKPVFHKGHYGHKYDYWSCGNCGATTFDGVLANYCMNCGYRILWDSPRCLTGHDSPKEEGGAKHG